MMGARKAGLLSRLINDQTLPGILAKMPPSDWRQWARERPTWMREAIEEAILELHRPKVEGRPECSGGRAAKLGLGRRKERPPGR